MDHFLAPPKKMLAQLDSKISEHESFVVFSFHFPLEKPPQEKTKKNTRKTKGLWGSVCIIKTHTLFFNNLRES
jgi:hypothetical protein